MTNKRNSINPEYKIMYTPQRLSERLKKGLLIFDGAMGTEIYSRHFFINTSFENLNLVNPQVIGGIHDLYLQAGAQVLTTNTFAANANKLAAFGLADKTAEINRAGVMLARSRGGENILIAASVGPYGENDNVRRTPGEVLHEAAMACCEADCDFVIFESISTLEDLKNAVKAAEDLPREFVFCMTLDEEGRTSRDKCPLAELIAAVPDKLRPTAWGLNCGKGPESTLKALEKLLPAVNAPVVVQPNAGEPRKIDGRTLYMCTPEYFTTYCQRYAQLGAAAIGGCCGVGPEHIKEMAASLRSFTGCFASRLPVLQEEDKTRMLPETPLAERSHLGAKLASGEWITTVEITPPGGYDLTSTVEKARLCREAGIDAINLPDGPRASARLTPLVAAIVIQQQAGIETVLHCCCRDRSMIGLQAELLGAAAAGVNNILAITGDPPKLGNYPNSSAVFDLDSVGLCAMQKRLNRGVDAAGISINKGTCAVIGVGFDPNAIDLDREMAHLCAKAAAGADFIVTQPVFEAGMLLKAMAREDFPKLPVIAGVWPLASLRNAEFMKNEVPGVVVPDQVIHRMRACSTKEEQSACGIEMAIEIIREIRPFVAGVQVSAPMGNVHKAIATIKGAETAR